MRAAKGEQTVRALAHHGFQLAQRASASASDCASVLVAFNAAMVRYGEGLVREWTETEAAVWRMVKRTCPMCGGAEPCPTTKP